jgi:isopenicillin N synthase-like dioxygenase
MKRSLVLPQDYGTITILWSQPVAGLQILSPDGKWRWIRHIDNAIVGVHHVLSLDA